MVAWKQQSGCFPGRTVKGRTIKDHHQQQQCIFLGEAGADETRLFAGCGQVAACGAAMCCLWCDGHRGSSDEESGPSQYGRLKPQAHHGMEDNVDVASLRYAEVEGPRD
jgi:hypothetical protein